VRLAAGTAGSQLRDQLATKLTAALHVQGLVDGLVHHMSFRSSGNSPGRAALICSGLHRCSKPILHERRQHGVTGQLA